MPFSIIRNDITKVRADAIVNTANPRAAIGSGTDRAIYNAAGKDELLRARKAIGDIAPGNAEATPAFGLDAKYIIHTVGPAWIDGNCGERETLRACYENSLGLAAQLGCESVAFPLIATGVYGFPRDLALRTATSAIYDFLLQNDMTVYLVVFDSTAYDLSAKIFDGVQAYIDENYVAEKRAEEYRYGNRANMRRGGTRAEEDREDASAYLSEAEREESIFRRRRDAARRRRAEAAKRRKEEEKIRTFGAPTEMVGRDIEPDRGDELPETCESDKFAVGMELDEAPKLASSKRPRRLSDTLEMEIPEEIYSAPTPNYGKAMPSYSAPRYVSLDDHLRTAGKSFHQNFVELVNESGMTNAEIYNKAFMSKQTFSKIFSEETKIPKKQTICALALALQLDLETANELLNSAGYSLSKSSIFDLCVEYFLINGMYNIIDDNIILLDRGAEHLLSN